MRMQFGALLLGEGRDGFAGAGFAHALDCDFAFFAAALDLLVGLEFAIDFLVELVEEYGQVRGIIAVLFGGGLELG